MKINVLVIVCSLALLGACNSEENIRIRSGEEVELTTAYDSVSYAIGVNVGEGLSKDILSSEGLDTIMSKELFIRGILDAIDSSEFLIPAEKRTVILQDFSRKFQERMMEEQRKMLREQYADKIKEAENFFAENKEKEGITAMPSGLQYEVLKKGNGPKPGPKDKVKVHYVGTLLDGTEFDSSIARGEPITLSVGGVIPGWQEALTLMPVGSKWKLYIPADLAYGEAGHGQIPPFAPLVFELELLSVDTTSTPGGASPTLNIR